MAPRKKAVVAEEPATPAPVVTSKQQLTPEQETKIRALKINDLTASYIQLRNKKAEIAKEAKEQIDKLDAGMEKLEVLMLAWLRLFGLDSAATPSGTAYQTVKTGASMGDREAFMKFVAEDFENRAAFLTNHVAKDTVKTYMDEHEGVPPPGINWYSEAAVNFRK